jgi:DNA-binding response OmpR family regulator
MGTGVLSQEKRAGVNRKILVVEADPLLRRSMSAQFERMDFHVLSASHYDGAVHHLAKGDIRVVCVDVQLPASPATSSASTYAARWHSSSCPSS